MPASNVSTNLLSYLFSSATSSFPELLPRVLSATKKPILKHCVHTAAKCLTDCRTEKINKKTKSSQSVDPKAPLETLSSDNAKKELSQKLSNFLGVPSLNTTGVSESALGKFLEFSSDLGISPNSKALYRKEKSRQWKENWVFKDTQDRHYVRLAGRFGKRLGTDTTVSLFDKLRLEINIKKYSSFIRTCIKSAKTTEDGKVKFDEIPKVIN